MYNDLIVFKLGLTTEALKKCYHSLRNFHIGQINLTPYLNKHLSRYYILSRKDPDYDHQKDPEYLLHRARLIKRCVNLRNKKKFVAGFAHNQYLIQESYRLALVNVFIALAIEEFPENKKELSSKIYDYFENKYIFHDKKKAELKIVSIKSLTNETFIEKLSQFENTISTFYSAVSSGDVPIVYHSIDDLLEGFKDFNEKQQGKDK